MDQRPALQCYRLLVFAAVVFVVGAALLHASDVGLASTTADGVSVLSPQHLAGASGAGDERDADIYPAVAYDAGTGRYLAVWLTARNAGSSSDGFDVYGVFVDQAGRPMSEQFRISDDNTAARNGPPAVAAGGGEFAVAWTAAEGTCEVVVQRVVDTTARADDLLVSGSGHRHSPSLTYNAARRRFALAYVVGDDYLPPTFFGADTAECGNNADSTSDIAVTEFYFSGDSPVTTDDAALTSVHGGSFRPHLVYDAELGQYLAVWEDRRNAGSRSYGFDVYVQRLSSTMDPQGGNVELASGGVYTNSDTSATWTPRPVVAGGHDGFLVVWFVHQDEGGTATWSVRGSLMPPDSVPGPAFTVAQMSFAQSHAEAPTGFLSAIYGTTTRQYVVGLTSHMESVWGYISFARIQRVSADGRLLTLDGAVQSSPSVGYFTDYDNDDQIAIGLAFNPIAGAGVADYLAVYAKHEAAKTAQDYDIWGARIPAPALYLQLAYVPVIARMR